MIYGFKDKQTAESAIALANSRPPQARSAEPVLDKFEQWLVKTPAEGIDAGTDTEPGKADCKAHELIAGTLTELDLTVEVFNVSKEAVPGDKIVPAWHVNGVPVVQTFGSSDQPWIRFQTTTKMALRQCSATVLLTTGGGVSVGDTVTIHDPNNLWATAEAGCTGTAYYRTPTNSNNVPAGVSRWEIETCSLPINKIIGRITSCLKATDTGVTVYFGSNWETQWMLSDYENVEIPPEATAEDANNWYVSALNTRKLTAVPDSWVVIERKTDRGATDTDVTGTDGGVSDVDWVITDVPRDMQIARWIELEHTGATPIVRSYWEGADPRLCTNPPNITNLLDSSCLKVGDIVLACYKPEDDSYVTVSSQSAMLGSPKTEKIPVGQMTAKEDNGNGIHCYEQDYKEVLVFQCGDIAPPPEKQDTLCIDGNDLYNDTWDTFKDHVCSAICFCPQFATSEECDTTPDCEGECLWQWTGTDWTNVNDQCVAPCSCLTPPAEDGTEPGEQVTLPCDQPPPPCGDCVYTWSGLLWVVLAGDNNCTGDCECGPPPTEDGTFEGEKRTVDCGEPLSECCEHCGGDAVDLSLLSGSGIGPTFAYSQNGPSTGGAGGCSWRVPVHVTEYDAEIPHDPVADYDTTATVTYDGTTWNVSVGSTPTYGYNMSWSAEHGCFGSSFGCDADCGDNDGTAMTISRTVCTDPPAGAASRAPGLGTMFAKENPDLFTGCGCKRDVVAVMNRWTGPVDRKNIERVASTIRAKNQTLALEELVELIQRAIDDFQQ